MIIDKIENMKLYTQIPADIADFAQNMLSKLEIGRHELGNNYVNIETYYTKFVSEGKFEAHKNYIDIQILLNGKEKIYYQNTENLIAPQPYNEEKDIMFFDDDITTEDYVTLDGTNFCLIYPHEAHAPQISSDNCINVKKAVFKIKL